MENRTRLRLQKVRSGFSLVTLLVVMLAGMALLGATFYIHDSFSNRTFMSVDHLGEKNYMDEAMEIGRAELVKLIGEYPGDGLPVAFFKEEKTANHKIEEVSDLELIDKDKRRWSKETYTKRISDEDVISIDIQLYDVLYTSSDIHPDKLEALQTTLPPGFSGDFLRSLAGGGRKSVITAPIDESGLSDQFSSDEAMNDGTGGNDDQAGGSVNIGLYMVRVRATDKNGMVRVTEAVIARGKE